MMIRCRIFEQSFATENNELDQSSSREDLDPPCLEADVFASDDR